MNRRHFGFKAGVYVMPDTVHFGGAEVPIHAFSLPLALSRWERGNRIPPSELTKCLESSCGEKPWLPLPMEERGKPETVTLTSNRTLFAMGSNCCPRALFDLNPIGNPVVMSPT